MKRFLLPVIVLVLLCAFCAHAEVAHEHTTAVSDGDTALTGSAEGVAYHLTGDTACGTVTVSGRVALCLRGHRLTVDTIVLGADSELSIYDCSEGAVGSIYSESGASPTITLSGKNAVLDIHAGSIVSKSKNGIDVTGANVTVRMDGGEIVCGGSGASGICWSHDSGSCSVSAGRISAVLAAVEIKTANVGVTISGGELIGNRFGVLFRVLNSHIDLSGGTYISQNFNADDGPVASIGEKVENLLADDRGYYYYDSDGALTSAQDHYSTKYSGKRITNIRSVEVLSTRSIVIKDADGTVYATKLVERGTAYRLPAELTPDGTTLSVKSYRIGDTEYAPGDSVTVTEDIDVTVAFRQSHTITFRKAGTVLTTAKVAEGETYTLPKTLTAADGTVYAIAAYVLDGTTYAPGASVAPEKDTDAEVTFKASFAVTFYNAGSPIANDTAIEGETYTLPETLSATDGKTYPIDTYVLGGVTYAAGAELEITGDTEIEAVGKKLVGSIASTEWKDGYYYLSADTECAAVKVTGRAVLCLHGKTLEVSTIELAANSELIIYDCVGTGRIYSESGSYPAIKLSGSAATLAIHGGTIEAKTKNGIEVTGANATVQMDGGRIVSSGTDMSGIYWNTASGSCSISAGALEAKYSAVRYNKVGGSLTISGGSFVGDKFGIIVFNQNAHNYVALSGGTFTANKYTDTLGPVAYQNGSTVDTLLDQNDRYAYCYSLEDGTLSTAEAYYTKSTGYENRRIAGIRSVSVFNVRTVTIRSAAAVDETGAKVLYATKTVACGSAYELPTELTKDGTTYRADVYTINGVEKAPGTAVTVDSDIEALVTWKPSYAICFYNAGTLIATGSVLKGEAYTLPETLTAADGTVYTVESYALGETTHQPGEALVIEAATDIRVILHSCSGVEYSTPVRAGLGTLSTGNYYLDGAVTATGEIHVSSTVRLCLNGRTMKNAKLILDESASLTLCDCRGTGVLESTGTVLTLGSGTTLDIRGGTIGTTGSSPAILLPSGTGAEKLTMKDCTIRGNGGNTLELAGTVSKRVTAEHCTILAGSKLAVNISGGATELLLTDCTIGLVSQTSTGGGIYVQQAATGSSLELDGCTVDTVNNAAILVNSVSAGSTLRMTDTTVTTNNTGDISGSVIRPVSCETTIEGCTVNCGGKTLYGIYQTYGTMNMKETEIHDTSTKVLKVSEGAVIPTAPGASFQMGGDGASAVLEQVSIETSSCDGISFSGNGYTATLTDCDIKACRRAEDGVRSALIMGGTGEVTITGGRYDGSAAGYGISNRVQLTIAGTPEISGSRCGILNKQNNATLTVTGAPTVQVSGSITLPTDIEAALDAKSDEVHTGMESALFVPGGTVRIAGGSYTGTEYGLYAGSSAGSVTLSGGVYACAEDGISPIETAKSTNVSAFLDKTIEGLEYHTAATGSEVFAKDVKQLDKATSLTAWVRVRCDHPDWSWTEQKPYRGCCTECGEVLVYILGDQMSIDETLSLTFWLRRAVPEAVTGTWHMSFTREHSASDRSYSSETSGAATGNDIAFTYHGINPQCMTTDIEATLTYSRDGQSDKELRLTDNVQSYCVRAFGYEGTTQAQKTLMADLLEYGAAAQVYMSWKKDLPANGGDAAQYMSYRTDPVKPDHTDSTYHAGSVFTGCSLRLSYKTQLAFGVKLPEGENDCIVVIRDRNKEVYRETVASGSARIYLDVAPQFYETVYSCNVYTASGTLVDSMDYSVSSYIYSGWSYSGAGLRNLLQAMQAYGAIARAVAGS